MSIYQYLINVTNSINHKPILPFQEKSYIYEYLMNVTKTLTSQSDNTLTHPNDKTLPLPLIGFPAQGENRKNISALPEKSNIYEYLLILTKSITDSKSNSKINTEHDGNDDFSTGVRIFYQDKMIKKYPF